MACEAHLSDPREAPKASSTLTPPPSSEDAASTPRHHVRVGDARLQMDQICALKTHQALLYNTLPLVFDLGYQLQDTATKSERQPK